MNRLFRSNAPSGSGIGGANYLALILFVLAYAAIVALLVAPERISASAEGARTILTD